MIETEPEVKKYAIIPCKDDVEFLIPYMTEYGEIKFHARPIVAWKVSYTETEDLFEDDSHSIPIGLDNLPLVLGIIFFHKTEIWEGVKLAYRGKGIESLREAGKKILYHEGHIKNI